MEISLVGDMGLELRPALLLSASTRSRGSVRRIFQTLEPYEMARGTDVSVSYQQLDAAGRRFLSVTVTEITPLAAKLKDLISGGIDR